MHSFSDLFDKFYSTCFGQVHVSIIRSISTLYNAIGVCHASSVNCLLAWSGYLLRYTMLRYSWWWTVDLSKTFRV